MNQQVMKFFTYHNYIVSHLLDYGLNRFVSSKQNFVNMMTQHRIEEIGSVDNIKSLDLEMSLKKPNATSTKFIG
jgi:hypothetical protein